MRRSLYIKDPTLIRSARKAMGFTISKLAGLVDVSKGCISQIENGKARVSENLAIRLSETLNLDLADIVNEPIVIYNEIPGWLRYLKKMYDLTEGDERRLKEIVRNTGMPQYLSGESESEFRSRWSRFYDKVQESLSNPSDRFFQDPAIQFFLSRLGIPETRNWLEIKKVFLKLVKKRCGSGHGCTTLREWRDAVCEKLNVNIINLANPEYRDYSARNKEIIEFGKAMVDSSDKMFGASYKLQPNGSGYVIILDTRSPKNLRGDYPFWHEAARLLLDSELNSGNSVSYIADGAERPPLERMLSRMAVWLAFSFVEANNTLEKLAKEDEFKIQSIKDVNAGLLNGATIRMIAMGLVDAAQKPIMYIDSQMRLKEAECRCAKISIGDRRAMAVHPNAKLRVGFVFRNCVAETEGVGVRYNMQIACASPIYEAYCRKKDCEGDELFSNWDSRYCLMGACATKAYYSSKGNNVRAFMVFDN